MSMTPMCFLIMLVFLQMSNATSVIGRHDHYASIVNDNYDNTPIIYQKQLAYPGMYCLPNVRLVHSINIDKSNIGKK